MHVLTVFVKSSSICLQNLKLATFYKANNWLIRIKDSLHRTIAFLGLDWSISPDLWELLVYRVVVAPQIAIWMVLKLNLNPLIYKVTNKVVYLLLSFVPVIKLNNRQRDQCLYSDWKRQTRGGDILNELNISQLNAAFQTALASGFLLVWGATLTAPHQLIARHNVSLEFTFALLRFTPAKVFFSTQQKNMLH